TRRPRDPRRRQGPPHAVPARRQRLRSRPTLVPHPRRGARRRRRARLRARRACAHAWGAPPRGGEVGEVMRPLVSMLLAVAMLAAVAAPSAAEPPPFEATGQAP